MEPASEIYVNSQNVNQNPSGYHRNENSLFYHDHLLALQEEKRPLPENPATGSQDSATSTTAMNPTTTNTKTTTTTKSKSLSNMANAFAKKLTIQGSKSFVQPPSTKSSDPSTSSNITATTDATPQKKKPEKRQAKQDTSYIKKASNPGNISNDKKSKYTVLKNPTVILRDVKNSIAQKFKSKDTGCSQFEKFHNEACCTPASAKLYSPFNVFTDSVKTQFNSRLNSDSSNDNGSGTPKRKSANKRDKLNQLKQKLVFDSPTGKFRESVNDVEQFQQDIHRINANICAKKEKQTARTRTVDPLSPETLARRCTNESA